MRLILLAILMMCSTHAWGEKDLPLPDVNYAKAMSAYLEIIKAANPPIPERCHERVRALVIGLSDSAATSKERQHDANAELAGLRADGCITDRHFVALAHDVKRERYSACLDTVSGGQGPTPPYTIRSVGEDAIVLHIRDFVWYSAGCADRNTVIGSMLHLLELELMERYPDKFWVLDLRNNSGGYLDVATKFLESIFSPDQGSTMITVRDLAQEDTVLRTRKQGAFVCPEGMLVNRRTASAAEIVAGVMSQWCPKMVIVGERTYGKGTTTRNVGTERFSVRFSTAEFFIGEEPDLLKINDVGLLPTVSSVLPPSEDASFSDRFNASHTGTRGDHVKLIVGIIRHPEMYLGLREMAETIRRESVPSLFSGAEDAIRKLLCQVSEAWRAYCK